MKPRFKDTRKRLNDLLEMQRMRREKSAKAATRKIISRPKPTSKVTSLSSQLESAPVKPVSEPPKIMQRCHAAVIPMYQDSYTHTSEISSALIELTDLYLHAAHYRSRHIAMIWPASFKNLTLVHVLATLTRWYEGDKQGIRGLLFPVKTNVFYRLNHLHFDRLSLLRIARELAENKHNPKVTRSMRDKDAFLFSLNDQSFRQASLEPFNPTIGEILPLFIASPSSIDWKACDSRLLARTRAKLSRRVHANALKMNCSVIGHPSTAPDAIFSLDGRMSEKELRQACKLLAKFGNPEVVMVQATRSVRREAQGWKRRLTQFCQMVEEVFSDACPGIIIVTDEPHAAYRLKDELWKRNQKLDPQRRWHMPHEFKVVGIPSSVGDQGLLPIGVTESANLALREFNISIVDADAAKVANKLARIASSVHGGKNASQPILKTASFISRLSALPCGVKHMSEYLSDQGISDRARKSFDWPTHIGAVHEFERNMGVGTYRGSLLECLDRGTKLFSNYHSATPFAHKLAMLVATNKQGLVIVFTNALYMRLAERFLSEYDQYPQGVTYEALRQRVCLIYATQLEEQLDRLQNSTLVFAGLNEDSLRLLLTDNRIPEHLLLLLTQRAGQFLRATLNPIVDHMPEFKLYMPRVKSILSQLKDLPEDASILSTGDYVLPTFRIELSSDISSGEREASLDSWIIHLDNETTLFRRDTSEVYVYDPISPHATEAGFRVCQVRLLEIGDKVFHMSAELREIVEQVLREQGVAIQSDKTFESALRSYHEQVQKRLIQRFRQRTIIDKVRAIREEMLIFDSNLVTKLPDLQSMRHWIDLQRSSDTQFEELKPQAPRDEAVFRAFAQVLGFSALEAAYQWQRVITAVRTSRRLDGRHISDIYAYMLLQPESAMAHSSIKRETLDKLFAMARENVATVEYVSPMKELK